MTVHTNREDMKMSHGVLNALERRQQFISHLRELPRWQRAVVILATRKYLKLRCDLDKAYAEGEFRVDMRELQACLRLL